MNCLLREGKVQKDQIHNADIRKEDENGMYLIERQKKILTLLLTSKEWITGAEITDLSGFFNQWPDYEKGQFIYNAIVSNHIERG